MRGLNPRAWSVDGECWCTRVDYDGYKKEWSGIAPVLAPDNRSKRIGEIEDTNIIVEFPTGLKDKNGKEIYEGDILGGIWEGGYISYCEKCKQFQYYSCGECMACLGDVHWYEIVEDDGKLEVIGNIHENPELLGEGEE